MPWLSFSIWFILKIFYDFHVFLVYFFLIRQVKEVYINFLNHCYIDTEVEVKEIYTSSHMWSLFERSFLVDMALVATATHDRKHADTALEHYVTTSVVNVITTFFRSPFSDQSTTVQVRPRLLTCSIVIVFLFSILDASSGTDEAAGFRAAPTSGFPFVAVRLAEFGPAI